MRTHEILVTQLRDLIVAWLIQGQRSGYGELPGEISVPTWLVFARLPKSPIPFNQGTYLGFIGFRVTFNPIKDPYMNALGWGLWVVKSWRGSGIRLEGLQFLKP